MKSATSDVDIGVQKIGNTTVQVGAIRAVVTYQPPAGGSLAIALSSNNGSTWTAAKTTALDATESVDAPSGNGATDLWGRTWTPANFNNGSFAVRITNASNLGTVNLDQALVTVNYTVPGAAPVLCQLGVSLSWNGGTTWTSGTTNPTKTQTLTGTEATYALGGDTDTWGRTWAPGDFVNGKFLARVHAIDPGSNCDNASSDHLDYLEMQVDYTIPGNPTQFATDAATAAKNAGTELFSIHFGDAAGQALMEQLSSTSLLPALTIAAASRSGTTITATTTAPNFLTKNQRIHVTGFSDANFNGTAITVTKIVNATTFQYTSTASGTKTLSNGTEIADELVYRAEFERYGRHLPVDRDAGMSSGCGPVREWDR